MEEFQKKGWFERRKIPIEELSRYYAEQREYEFSTGKRLKGIKTRKKFYPLVKLILVIDKLFSGEKIIIINDAHRKNIGAPTIYACTHIGGNDIQRTLQVIHDSAYLMLSNPKILYKKAIYLGLKLNGVIPLESEDRTDRKIAYARTKELLMRGETC